MNNRLIFNCNLLQATSVLQNKCSREPLLQLEKPPCLVKNKPCYTCFSVKIRTFAHRSLSLTKRMNHLHNKSPVHFQLFHSSSDIYNPSDARSIFAFQRTIAVLVSMYLVVPFDFTPVFLSLRTGISLIKRSIPGAKLEKKGEITQRNAKNLCFWMWTCFTEI